MEHLGISKGNSLTIKNNNQMASTQPWSIHKVANIPSSLIAGGIYFVTSTGQIRVATSTSSSVCMSGVTDVNLSGSTLTITKFNGTTVQVKIDELAKSALSSELLKKLDIGTEASDTSSTKSYYGLLKKINEVQASVATVYRPKGSKTIEELEALTGVQVGDVYNITDKGIINDTTQVNAGDNVAALTAGNGADVEWDVLAGTVDLTGYATSSSVNSKIGALTVNGKNIGNATGGNANLVLAGGDLLVGGEGDYADNTITEAIDAIAEALGNAITSAVTSFGGQTGAITVDTANNKAGQVKFAMSGKNLTGIVNGWATKVDTTRTVNSKPLSANVVLGGGDIQCGSTSENFEDVTIAAAIDMITQTLIPGLGSWTTWE